MKQKAFVITILIFALLSLGALAGITLLQSTEPVKAPNLGWDSRWFADLKVDAVLLKTQYLVGERILLSKTLYNLDDEPRTFLRAESLLFFRVYAKQYRIAASKTPGPQPGSLVEINLSPGVPDLSASWVEHYSFALDQPGWYKLVAWAELSLDVNGSTQSAMIYGEPMWIEIVTGR